ncbi:oxidoreductase [Vibrio mediterranei]
MTFSPIKTAVIGYGFSAKTFHIPFLATLDEFDLVAISTSRQEVKGDWSNAQHYEQADFLLRLSDAELVIITAPNDVHFELAKTALENGKHVIIEKPFVTNIADGEELISLAKERGLVLSVYHNRRWDGDFLTVKKMLNEQRFGELKHFESHFDRFRPEVRQRWREQTVEGGGILFDLGSHLIDQAITLFGVPEAISADCKMMRQGSTNVDYFHLTLHYPQHLAVLHGDMFTAGPNKRFTVKGTGGSYIKYGLDPQEERLIAGTLPATNDWSEEEPFQYGSFYDANSCTPIPTERGCYQEYFHQIAQAIRTDSACPVNARDALLNIQLIELAIESSRLGRKLFIKDTQGK